ncbi:MAG: putative holin [Methylobacter tundripaludum]|nr:putative holin [Methylobacter tundripaludum]
MKLPRLFSWLLISVLLLIVVALLYPQQLGVSLYKLSLVSVAGVIGYWLDRSLFPYARPDGYLAHNTEHRHNPHAGDFEDADYRVNKDYHTVFAAALLRRAIIVAAAMLAMGLGA